MNGDVLISVGDYEVFSNGTVISHNSSPILFQIHNLKIKFVFATSQDGKPELSTSFVDNNECLQFTLTNFNSPLGIGLNTPFMIGHINGRTLYFLFIVYMVGKEGTRMCSYTWLTKKDGV